MKPYSFDEYWEEFKEEIKYTLPTKFTRNRVYSTIKYFLESYKEFKGEKHPKLRPNQWDKVIESFNVLYVVDEDYPNSRQREIIIDRDYIDQYFEDFKNSNKIDHRIMHFVKKKIILYRGYNAGKFP